jgi:hypothetical protein
MQQLQLLSDFFSAIEKDPRISITHIGIYAALLQCWKNHNCSNPVRANSKEIMQLAKITGRGTYFKIIKELSNYGYINYVPSNKRNRSSKFYVGLSENKIPGNIKFCKETKEHE